MKTIKDYLIFWIKNWCDDCALEYIDEVYWSWWDYQVNYIEDVKEWHNALYSIICKKSFIEAVAKGLCMEDKIEFSEYSKEELIDDITKDQAIAIRDNKLEEFINNLWIWKIQ